MYTYWYKKTNLRKYDVKYKINIVIINNTYNNNIINICI